MKIEISADATKLLIAVANAKQKALELKKALEVVNNTPIEITSEASE